MSTLIKRHFEKLLLAVAAGAVVVGGWWAWRHQPAVRLVRDEPEQPVFTGAAPAPAGSGAEAPKHAWARPPAQSAGEGWLYEVFTPPEIYYHAPARTFAVTPPYYAPEATETVFGLELLAVKRVPYRLQLAGYFGKPGDYLAAFVSSEVPQTLLARTGRRFEQLGLTLKSFVVSKIAVESGAPGPVYDIAALAVLHDDETDGEVMLDSREMNLTDTPVAVFQAPDGKGRPRELHEGDTFGDADAIYRIERIQLDPPEVVVARSTPGLPVPETMILHPAEAGADHVARRPPRLKSFPSRPATGIANQGP